VPNLPSDLSDITKLEDADIWVLTKSHPIGVQI
jgi:hypothetical protein